jgi:DeoR/GlpR family transcriptional regulator of sugar metabolism
MNIAANKERTEVLTERKKEIYDLLCNKKQLSVAELSKMLYVSEMTIRRDLTEMEAQGYIRRYRGGAMVLAEEEVLPIDQRMLRDEDEKRAIAKRVEPLLHSNQNVYIDSSSICQYILPYLKKLENIRIVTNSVKTLLMATAFHIPCHLLGGDYFPLDMCFLGSVTQWHGERINVDIAFFSSRGLSNDGIISDISLEQNALRRCIMKNSGKNVFLFEKEKTGKKYLHTLCRVDEVDQVIL